MVENKARLVDATKRLLQSGTSEDEAIKSMTEVGLSYEEAKSIVEEAKNLANSPESKKMELPEGVVEKESISSANTQGSIYGTQSQEIGVSLSKPYNRIGLSEFRKISPVFVSDFDRLIEKGGLKRGDIMLLSGSSGTGKTTFAIQSIYTAAKVKGEKCIYISLEESPEKVKENMAASFGWDLVSLENKGFISMHKIDPLAIVRAMEANLTSEKGDLYIPPEQFKLPFLFDLPFKPDRLVFDSLSSLSLAFAENTNGFRQYTSKLFETISSFGALNIIIDETARVPGNYHLTGMHELLADSLVALYSLKTHNRRENVLEIIKMRGTGHSKRLVPYKITSKGFEIYADQEFFYED
jgi:KaiC/GvpD/RAD55 family RecA-like ATPase